MKLPISLIFVLIAALITQSQAGFKDKIIKKAAGHLFAAAAGGGALGFGYGYLLSKNNHEEEGGNTHIYNYASHGHKSDVKIINLKPKHH